MYLFVPGGIRNKELKYLSCRFDILTFKLKGLSFVDHF